MSKIYISHGRNDLAQMSEKLLERYASLGEEAFIQLIEAKYALIDKLAVESAARPFTLVDLKGPDDKKQKTEQGHTSRSTMESSAEIEIKITDHNGKSRITKARPSTLMREIIDWYGPRSGRATIVNVHTGDRVSSETTLRKLADSSKSPLDIKIVRK